MSPDAPSGGWFQVGSGVKSQLYCLVAVWPWASVVASLSLVFHTCKSRLLEAPASLGCCEGQTQGHVAAKGPVTEQRWGGDPTRHTTGEGLDLPPQWSL